MPNVDERVVKMTFDNAQFEQGVSTTMRTLESFKQSLDLSGVQSSLDGLSLDADALNVDDVTTGLDSIKNSFSALDSFVSGIFLRLGGRVADFGMNVLQKATVAPVMDGFKEYELQMKSVQTISANTGLEGADGINKINGVLDDLNEYADQTIYNFSEMTRNIGTFTAAGVDLETSATAIKGIANMAAVSGSTSQQASTAMYQLSQALAAGSVKLQDWNSVVNAGMGGKTFQTALLRTARAMAKNNGIATDYFDAIENGSVSFRESLKDEWITADVLTKTLEQLTMATADENEYIKAYNKLVSEGHSEQEAEDILKLANAATAAATKVRTWTQLWETVNEAIGSGWSTTWRLIVGDFLEATDVFTYLNEKISGVVNASSDARNQVLSEWKELGGRDVLFEALQTFIEAIESWVTPIVTAFNETFAIVGEDLVKFSELILRFAQGLKASETSASLVGTIFKTLFGLIKTGLGILSDLTNYISKLVSAGLKKLSPVLKIVAGILKDVLPLLTKAADKARAFMSSLFGEPADVIQKIANAFLIFAGAIGLAALKIYELGSYVLKSKIFQNIIGSFKTMVHSLEKNEIFGPFITSLLNLYRTIRNVVGPAFSSLKQTISEALSSDTTYSQKLSTIWNKIKSTFKKLYESVAGSYGPQLISSFEAVKTAAVDAFWKIIDFFRNLSPESLLEVIQKTVDSAINLIKNLPSFIRGPLTSALNFIKSFFGDVLEGSETFSDAFTKAIDKVKESFEKAPDSIKSLFDSFKRLLGYGASNAAAELEESTIANAPDKLAAIAEGLGAVFTTILTLGDTLSDTVVNTFKKSSEGIKDFLMDVPIEKLQQFSELAKSITFVFLINAIKNLATTINTAGGKILDWPDKLGKALGNFGKGWAPVESNADKILKVAIGIGILAASLFVIASLPADDLMRAAFAIGILSAVLVGLMLLIGVLDKLKAISTISWGAFGAGLKGMGVGVLALSVAAVILSTLDTDAIGKGVVAILGLAGAAAIFTKGVGGKGLSLIAGALAFIAFGAALKFIVPVIERIGAIPIAMLQKGVGAIVAIILALAAFGFLAGGGFAAIFKSIALLGVSLLAVSVAVVILAAGLLRLKATVEELLKTDPETIEKMGQILVAFFIALLALSFAGNGIEGIGLAAMILALAASIAIIAYGLNMLLNLPIKKIEAGLLIIIVIAAAMYSIGQISIEQGGSIFKLALSLVAFSVGLLILVGVLKSLQGLKMEEILPGVLSLFLLLIAFGAVVSGGDKAMPAALGILVFAGAVIALVFALKLLESVNIDAIGGGIIVLMGALIGFVAIALVLKSVEGIIIPMSIALLAFAGSVLILTAAMYLLQGIRFADIWQGFVGLVLAFFGFIGIAHIMAGLSGILISSVLTLLAFSAAVLMLSASLWLLQGIPFEEMISKLIAIGVALLAFVAVAALLSVISGPLLAAGAGLFLLAAAIFVAVLAITIFIGVIENLDAAGAFLRSFASGAVSMFGAIGDAIGGMLGFVTEKATGFMDWLGEQFGTGSDKVAEGAIEGLGKSQEELDRAYNDMYDFDSSAPRESGEKSATEMTDAVAETIEENVEGNDIYNPANWIAMNDDPSSLDLGSLRGMMDEMGVNIEGMGLESLANLDFSEGLGTSILGSISNVQPMATDAMSNMFNTSVSSVDIDTSSISAAGDSMVSAFSSSTEPMVANTQSLMDTIGVAFNRDYSPEGTSSGMSFSNGIVSTRPAASLAAASVGNATKDNLYVDTTSTGENVVNGLISGMTSSAWKAYEAARRIAKDLKKTIDDALEVNSPSKVMVPTGEAIPEGVAVGMIKMQSYLGKVSADTGNVAVDSMNSALSNLDAAIEEASIGQIMPTVMPIVSADNLSSQLDSMSATFGARFADADPLGINRLNELTYGTELSTRLYSLENSNEILRREIRSLTTAIEEIKPSTIVDARGMSVNDRNTMSLVAEDVVNVFLKRGLM